jgi:hypothetical protein
MAVAKRPRASAGANRGSAPANPCCPDASDLVVLAMANPMSTGGTTRGLRRIRSDGTSISSEYVEPYGYVIPKGKCLVVTDLYGYFSKLLRDDAKFCMQSPGAAANRSSQASRSASSSTPLSGLCITPPFQLVESAHRFG